MREMIVKLNIIDNRRKKNLKKKIKNTTFSLLSSNCIGGIIYHDLGLEFLSPTINTMIKSRDFIKFVINLEEYLTYDLKFIKTKKNFPVAILKDITIYFTHYESEQEALFKWNERKKRIQWDNLYIITNDRDGVTKEDVLSLSKIKCKGKIVFTSKKYDDIPYAVQIKKFAKENQVGNILKKSILSGKREFEKNFDYIYWLNTGLIKKK